jgi:RNA polymerase sigma-70 factor (ECF subfamily)
MMLDHAEALRACAAGDRSGLKALFDAEAGRLLGVAMRILRRRDLAEDAVQDAFVQVWRHASTFEPTRGSPRGWLNAIVRNRALTILRESSREDVIPEDPAEGVREEYLLEHAADRLEANSRLKDCLQLLDESKRRCVLMAYLFGYTHGEIAGRLNVPLGTAKAWVRRGLQALRECLS